MVDEERLHTLVGQFVDDMAAALSAVLVRIGDRLGLYRAMAGAGPLTSDELADRAGCAERYVREWLNNQAAGGYVDYDPAAGTYELSEEQAMLLADEDSPLFLQGGFDFLEAAYAAEPKILDAFRTGHGVGWHEHHPCLFPAVARFFRAGYRANLFSSWLPALDGVVPKLESGARVADVGCGHGTTTIMMAEAFPNSTFVGFDYHDGSIAAARKAAADAGVATRCSFEVASANDYPGTGYDLVCVFDALHDMGDPVGAAAHIRGSLADDGTWLLVEPYAGDRVEDNLNPVGRTFYASSTLVCTPASLAQDVGLALGAQAGEARIREVVGSGGFSRFRRATETPFNLVFEARP
jgi:SAM-dependent methyltransferase